MNLLEEINNFIKEQKFSVDFNLDNAISKILIETNNTDFNYINQLTTHLEKLDNNELEYTIIIILIRYFETKEYDILPQNLQSLMILLVKKLKVLISLS